MNDAASEGYRENETSSAEPVERDEDVEAAIEQERKRIEALSTATWDDPIKVDWGDVNEEEPVVEPPPVASPPPTGDTVSSGHRESWSADPAASEPDLLKCVAIYTYTVSKVYRRIQVLCDEAVEYSY